ncbi:MAG: hypothetical protein AB7D57_14575 [Desulfovibrionaceae bacterium]
MILTERHLQILKHIHAYSKIKQYHGMVPRKEAASYDERLLQSLLDNGLVEEGVIITTCGSNPKGYRLSEEAKHELEGLGLNIQAEEWDRVKESDAVANDRLDKEHIETLVDVYHFSKIKKFNGIAPKFVVDNYDKDVVKFLYDAGYIFYIKLKGARVENEKGYVLSERATRLLEQAGLAR